MAVLMDKTDAGSSSHEPAEVAACNFFDISGAFACSKRLKFDSQVVE